MLVIAGTIPVKAEYRDEARKLARMMEEETRKEPGCLRTLSMRIEMIPTHSSFLKSGSLMKRWQNIFKLNI